jgi:hypothetical protein
LFVYLNRSPAIPGGDHLKDVKPLIICFSIFSGFPVSSKAEDPVMLGQRGTLNVFAPVPVKTSQVVRTKAAGMLARHVKPYKGSLLSELKFGGNRVWMEMKGLQLTHVTANAVSQADQANGTLESYMVSVDCEMYRSYGRRTQRTGASSPAET